MYTSQSMHSMHTTVSTYTIIHITTTPTRIVVASRVSYAYYESQPRYNNIYNILNTSSYIILASILLCHMHTSSYSSSIYTLQYKFRQPQVFVLFFIIQARPLSAQPLHCLQYVFMLRLVSSIYSREYLLDHGVLLFLKSVHSLTRSMGEGTNLRCISSRLQYPTSGHSGNSQRFILSLLGPMLWSGGTVPANQICLMPSSSASC